ncbi:uncharacterized protein CDAR_113471 [Caerostris darwini]|uniref:Uncharacterized protein n=1 Tax=Caerostris darwini TaxID=1538125 RepID=A0AAV4R5V2_9ARAC|nr:uncharacterized protein CDAR_113471 [Caerostris darwini]
MSATISSQLNYSLFLKLLYSVILIHCGFSAPVNNTESLYSLFLKELEFNQCSIPDKVQLPFNDAHLNNFEYLSSYLQICQNTESTIRSKEAVNLCKEIFNNIRSISCSPKTISLPDIDVQLSKNICPDIANLTNSVPEDKSFLKRLTDGFICEIMCEKEFEKACQILLWSYEVQKQISDTENIAQSKLAPNSLEKTLEMNDNLKTNNEMDENKTPQAETNKAADNTLHSILQTVKNEATTDQKSTQTSSTVNEPQEKSSSTNKNVDQNQQIPNQQINDAVQLTNDTKTYNANTLDKITETVASTSVVTLGNEQDEINPDNVNFAGNVEEPRDHPDNQELKNDLTLNEIDTEKKNNNELTNQLGNEKKLPNAEDLQMNEKGTQLENKLSGNNHIRKENEKVEASSTTIIDGVGINQKQIKTNITSNTPNIKVTEQHLQNTDITAHVTDQAEHQPNSITAAQDKSQMKTITRTETPDQTKDSGVQKISKLTSIDSNHTTDANEGNGNEVKNPISPDVSKQVKETDQTNINSGNMPVKTKPEILDENPTVQSIGISNTEMSSFTSSPSKVPTESTILLEKMEGENDINQPGQNNEDQYDLENTGDDEFSSPDYDGNNLYDAKNKEPNPEIPTPVKIPKESISNQNEKPIPNDFSPNLFEHGQSDIQMIATFPDAEDSHFFFYFLSIVLIVMIGYLVFHNKQKIIALIVEGRHERNRRSHRVGYKKLENK